MKPKPGIADQINSKLLLSTPNAKFLTVQKLAAGTIKNVLFDEIATKSPEFRLIWLNGVSGKLQLDANWYMLAGDTVCCIAPGSVCRIQGGLDGSGAIISFTQGFVQNESGSSDCFSWCNQYERFMDAPVITVTEDNRRGIQETVNQIAREYDENGFKRAEILRGLLHLFVLYFSVELSVIPESYANRDRELMRKFMTLLRTSFISRKMVCDYAVELLVTPNHLNRAIKRLTGKTASYHIQQQIVLEAKRKAIQHGSSMKEVAYALGFDDLAHFSRFFKNNSGVRFSDFRKSQADPFGLKPAIQELNCRR